MAGIKNFRGRWVERLSKLLFGFSLVFLLLGLINIGWSVWPAPTDGIQISIPEGILPGAPAGTAYTSMADYVLTVTWPWLVRSGAIEEIQVILVEVEETAPNPMVDHEAQVLLIEPAFYTLPLTPPGRMQVNLGAGQELDLTWQVEGIVAGDHPGKLFVSFGFYDQALAELVPVPVAVVDMTIRVKTLWGLESQAVLLLGLLAMLLWGLFFVSGRLFQARYLRDDFQK